MEASALVEVKNNLAKSDCVDGKGGLGGWRS